MKFRENKTLTKISEFTVSYPFILFFSISTENLGHQDMLEDSTSSRHSQQFSMPTTESGVNFSDGSRLQAPFSSFTMDHAARPNKRQKTHQGVQDHARVSSAEQTPKSNMISKVHQGVSHEPSIERSSANRSSKMTTAAEEGGAISKQNEGIKPKEKVRKTDELVKQRTENESIELPDYSPSHGFRRVKTEPLEEQGTENDHQKNSGSSHFGGYDLNWMQSMHKFGQDTYLSKPIFDQGMFFFLLKLIYSGVSIIHILLSNCLTFFIRMYYFMHIDIMSLELFILYFNWLSVKISIK